jgi:hypothetical protein
VADVNGDNIPDIVVAVATSLSQASVVTFLGKGDGTFSTPTSVPLNQSFITALRVADLNLDGKPDVMLSSCWAIRPACSWRARATARSAPCRPCRSQSLANVIPADVNDDGKADLIGLNDFGQVSVLLNITGQVPPPVTASLPQPLPYALAMMERFLGIVRPGDPKVNEAIRAFIPKIRNPSMPRGRRPKRSA